MALALTAIAATAVVALVIVLTEGPAPSTSRVSITSASRPAPGSLLAYQHKTLMLGPGTAQMAPLPGTSPASRADCVAELGSAPVGQLRPHRGQLICLELTGQPARYALVVVETATPTTVVATVTIWP